MKPVIHHAVVRSPYGYRGVPYLIIDVTTERGRQVYGRFNDGASTHVAERDVLARLPDRRAAERFLNMAEKIKAKHRRPIHEARQALLAAEIKERRELEALVAEYRNANL